MVIFREKGRGDKEGTEGSQGQKDRNAKGGVGREWDRL
jgi:hypothetical protein